MYKAPPKKSQLIRRITVYSLMTIGVVSVVALLVLVMLGYRFNRETSTIQQGGLVQFDSRPTGSNVKIGTAKLGNLTPSKITVNPGNYDVVMSKSGYKQWTKNVDVNSGQVLWLNYARLMPETIETDELLTFDSVSDVKSSPNGERLAVIEDRTEPEVKFIDVSGSEPRTTTISIPSSAVSLEAPRYKLHSWSFDSRRVLLTATAGGTTEWVLIDRSDEAGTVNLSTKYDSAISKIKFDPRGSERLVYTSRTGQLRFIDTGSDTLSPVQATNVDQFGYYNDDAVVFVRTISKQQRSIDYLSFGEKQARELKRVQTTEPVLADMASYFGDPYLLTSVGTKFTIERFRQLPSSNSDEPIAMTTLSEKELPADPTFVSLRSGGRFAVAQYRGGVDTYDIELDRHTMTNLKKDVTEELRWFDRYHFYVTDGTMLRMIEFDGGNPSTITPLTTRFDSVMSSNGKFVYSIDKKSDDSFALQRSQTILD